jgi:hypothetical protein
MLPLKFGPPMGKGEIKLKNTRASFRQVCGKIRPKQSSSTWGKKSNSRTEEQVVTMLWNHDIYKIPHP